jgi:glycosyltransferase involved in cell wall biosynthesis
VIKIFDHITVCICTYRRPELLLKLLNRLNTQKTDDAFTYSIVVVDNDEARTAADTVELARSHSLIEIQYYCEINNNIARARNRTVQHAKGNYIAFIDDDEIPGDNWLLNLFKASTAYKAEGVLGPVIPYYEKQPPKWVIKGRFFERPMHRTGMVLHWSQSRTGNVLFEKKIISYCDEPFNPQFKLQGEDLDFFRRMNNKGYKFIWCEDAPVYEYVPASRLTQTYFLRRAYIQGYTSLMQYRDNWQEKVYILVKSIIAVIAYLFILPFTFIVGFHMYMKILIKAIHHLSRLLAFSCLASPRNRNLQ